MTNMIVKVAKVGDEVVMKMDKEARSWGRQGVPNGTKGVVIGKNRHQRHYARIGIDTYSKNKPGIYEADSTLQIRWEDGTEDSQSWDIEFSDKKLYEARMDKLWRKPVFKNGDYDADLAREQESKLLNEVFIGELPETKFWEGDVVLAEWNGHNHYLLISHINYHYLNEKRVDGSPMPIYDIRFCDENGVDKNEGSSWLHQDKEIILIKRGNLWNEYHNKQLKFRDLAEEVSFYRSLYQYTELRNPANMLYSWTAKEALEAIRKGDADGFGMTGNFLGLESKPQPFKMNDRELGERLRQATIAGFAGCTDPDVQ